MSDDFDLIIRAARVVCGGREVSRAIGLREGRIAAIEPITAWADAQAVLEFERDVVVLPGLVDSHVHVCEPGNTEREGFATATKAAAAGGITTLIDMPLDSMPITVDTAALAVKREAAASQSHIDVGFLGGVIPGGLGDLVPLHEAGVVGFKCFLGDSGSPYFPPISPGEMVETLAVLRGLGSPLLIHAESAEAAAHIPRASGRKYGDYLASHPRGLENLAIAQIIEAARKTGGRAHVLHLSSSDALPMLATARREHLPVTAETCPHYLTLCAEEIPDGATAFKCAPPIRERANLELLWTGLRDGLLDLIVSDHSPSTVAMKQLDSGDFGTAWGGVSSLQLGLPIVWTAARRRGFSLADVALWMAQGPARLAGLESKGRIAVGCDADFCVVAPDESFVVDPVRLLHRNPVTAYAGRELMGVVRTTILRGRVVDFVQPRGQMLRRGAA
jgi:allantoinase